MRILSDEKAITKTIMCLRWHAVLCTGVKLLDLESGGQSLSSVHDIKTEHNSVILMRSLERLWLKLVLHVLVETEAMTRLQQTQRLTTQEKWRENKLSYFWGKKKKDFQDRCPLFTKEVHVGETLK